jgi:predicted acylesterase/phospholipase RssA
MTKGKTVGLVVAGAAARGAYEAGALSVLIPTMAHQGKPPTVLVGNSTGAINAVLLAQYNTNDNAQAPSCSSAASRAAVEDSGWESRMA